MWFPYPAAHSIFLPKWSVTQITPPCYLLAPLSRGGGQDGASLVYVRTPFTGMPQCCLVINLAASWPWTAGPRQRGRKVLCGRPAKQESLVTKLETESCCQPLGGGGGRGGDCRGTGHTSYSCGARKLGLGAAPGQSQQRKETVFIPQGTCSEA